MGNERIEIRRLSLQEAGWGNGENIWQLEMAKYWFSLR